MKRASLIPVIIIALIAGFGLLVATASDAEVASIDIFRPATFLSFLNSRLDAAISYVR